MKREKERRFKSLLLYHVVIIIVSLSVVVNLICAYKLNFIRCMHVLGNHSVCSLWYYAWFRVSLGV